VLCCFSSTAPRPVIRVLVHADALCVAFGPTVSKADASTLKGNT